MHKEGEKEVDASNSKYITEEEEEKEATVNNASNSSSISTSFVARISGLDDPFDDHNYTVEQGFKRIKTESDQPLSASSFALPVPSPSYGLRQMGVSVPTWPSYHQQNSPNNRDPLLNALYADQPNYINLPRPVVPPHPITAVDYTNPVMAQPVYVAQSLSSTNSSSLDTRPYAYAHSSASTSLNDVQTLSNNNNSTNHTMIPSYPFAQPGNPYYFPRQQLAYSYLPSPTERNNNEHFSYFPSPYSNMYSSFPNVTPTMDPTVPMYSSPSMLNNNNPNFKKSHIRSLNENDQLSSLPSPFVQTNLASQPSSQSNNSNPRFGLLQQPQEIQRKSYRTENRCLLPNPLIVSSIPYANNLPKILKGYATVKLVAQNGAELPADKESLLESLTGSKTEKLDETLCANFSLKIKETSEGHLWRLKFIISFVTEANGDCQEEFLSRPFAVYSNRRKAGGNRKAADFQWKASSGEKFS